MKIVATVVSVVFVVRVAIVSFKDLPPNCTMKGIPVLAVDRNWRISIATGSNGLVFERRLCLRCLIVIQRYSAHS